MPTVVKTETVAKRKSTHLTIRSSRYLLPLALNGVSATGVCFTPGLGPSDLSKSKVIHLRAQLPKFRILGREFGPLLLQYYVTIIGKDGRLRQPEYHQYFKYGDRMMDPEPPIARV